MLSRIKLINLYNFCHWQFVVSWVLSTPTNLTLPNPVQKLLSVASWKSYVKFTYLCAILIHQYMYPYENRNMTSQILSSRMRCVLIIFVKIWVWTCSKYSIKLFIEYTTQVKNYMKWDLENLIHSHTAHRTLLTAICMLFGTALQSGTFGSSYRPLTAHIGLPHPLIPYHLHPRTPPL